MADAGRRKFDAVIVWRFDRFARSVSHLLRALENFHALDLVRSLSPYLHPSSPTRNPRYTIALTNAYFQ